MQLQFMYGYSIQVVFTGTPTGTFKLQASCDSCLIADFPNFPTNWQDITDSPFTVSSAGDYVWNVFDVMYNWVRVVYTDASGGTSTAVITSCTFNGKGV
jgi:hypothetical protein